MVWIKKNMASKLRLNFLYLTKVLKKIDMTANISENIYKKDARFNRLLLFRNHIITKGIY